MNNGSLNRTPRFSLRGAWIRKIPALLSIMALILSIACVGSGNILQLIGNKQEVKMIGKSFDEIADEYGSLSMAYLEDGELHCVFEKTPISFIFDRGGIDFVQSEGNTDANVIAIPAGVAAKSIDPAAVCIGVYGRVNDYGIANPEILSSAVKEKSVLHEVNMDYFLFPMGDDQFITIIPEKGKTDITKDSEIKVSVDASSTSTPTPNLPTDPLTPNTPTDSPTPTPESPTPTPETPTPTPESDLRLQLKNAKVGEYVTFGRFEQDNDLSEPEPIEWRVLDKDGDSLLLISKYALKRRAYSGDRETAWEYSPARKWLNEDFLNEAFNTEEAELIQETWVTPDKNAEHPGVWQGNSISNKVFLLSADEAKKYFSNDSERRCEETEYVKRNSNPLSDGGKYCYWWLRTIGQYSNYAAVVMGSGEIDYTGDQVDHGYRDIRPAIWVNP